MNCTIEERDAFQTLAVSRAFHRKDCFQEIPKFRTDYYAQGNGRIACGQYGVCCAGDDRGSFRYAIGQ